MHRSACGPSPWVIAIAAGVVLGAAATARAQDADPAAKLLADRGCLGCHSLDGTPRVGPSFASSAGRSRRVLTAGTAREVTFDVSYVRRAILDPDADLVDGHPAGTMPRLARDESDASALAEAVVAVASRPPPRAPASRSPVWLALASLGFVLWHVLGSSRPVRSVLIARLREGGFQGVYSLVVLGFFVWMVLEWIRAPYVELFRPPGWTRWIPNVIMPVSYILLVAGYTAKSPTVAGMAGAASAGPSGFARITRHPALWGFALWGLSHLATNGDLRSLCLMGAIATLALAGMLHIDARRRASGGEAWAAFEKHTSVVPFAAILRGEPWPTLGELGWWRIALGLGSWGAMLAVHAWLIGVSPLP